MAFYSAFQTSAYQWNAYQIAIGTVAEETVGDDSYVYLPSQQQEKIKRKKNDLDRLESVLAETERKKALATESKKLANETNKLKRALELESLEREYLNEINRLFMVRADLIRRIRSDEELLVIMILARKRRLRFVFQPASGNTLH